MGVVEASGRVPEKAAGVVRVMSWNVLRASPEKSPGEFARVIRAVEPDVILVQEWDDADGRDLEGWFRAHVDGRVAWSAVSVPEFGVGVVSRHAIVSDGRLRVRRGSGGGGATVRAMPAVVAVEGVGRVGVMSVHFKCCGSSVGAEEERRVAEAGAVRDAVWELFDAGEVEGLVVGGDYNLVGSRGPLEVLMDGGDVDGSDLAAAEAVMLGDDVVSTWRSGGSEFTPGRLDWVVYSDALGEVREAFVVDVERLGVAERERVGLLGGETGASDHLPVVVDVGVR
jgi:endonuclease/exonuclease/phosphatase family metal-dependent hydrolase